MIKPFTCVCMLLAAGSGLYLYQTKHRSQMLDREISRTLKLTDVARDRIGVLKGEWALLNEPERLAELTQQHLNLHTLSPTQFASMADLGNRLPAPLPQGRTVVPAEEAPTTVETIPIAAVSKPIVGTRVAAASPVAAPRPAAVSNTATSNAPSPTPPLQLAALPLPPTTAVAAVRTRPATPLQTTPVSAPTPPNPAPRQVTPPSLPATPAAPRLMAPIMSVSASPMGTPAAPAPARIQGLTATRATPTPVTGNAIGESVARASRANQATVQRTAATMPSTTFASVMPATASNMGAPATYSASMGSALGGARSSLPAPVPYNSTAR